MTDDLHNTILDIARCHRALNCPPNEVAIFCAIKQPGQKVCAHLSWVRQSDIEKLPVEFLQANVRMGARR